jgi:hypothetical protein
MGLLYCLNHLCLGALIVSVLQEFNFFVFVFVFDRKAKLFFREVLKLRTNRASFKTFFPEPEFVNVTGA